MRIGTHDASPIKGMSRKPQTVIQLGALDLARPIPIVTINPESSPIIRVLELGISQCCPGPRHWVRGVTHCGAESEGRGNGRDAPPSVSTLSEMVCLDKS